MLGLGCRKSLELQAPPDGQSKEGGQEVQGWSASRAIHVLLEELLPRPWLLLQDHVLLLQWTRWGWLTARDVAMCRATAAGAAGPGLAVVAAAMTDAAAARSAPNTSSRRQLPAKHLAALRLHRSAIQGHVLLLPFGTLNCQTV